MDSLLAKKCALYAALLTLDKPTDEEINVMYYLCRDRSVQAHLQKVLDNERSNVHKS